MPLKRTGCAANLFAEYYSPGAPIVVITTEHRPAVHPSAFRIHINRTGDKRPIIRLIRSLSLNKIDRFIDAR